MRHEQYVRALRDQLLASGQIPEPYTRDHRRFDLYVEPNQCWDNCHGSLHTLVGVALGPGPNELTVEELYGVVGQHTCHRSSQPNHRLAVFRVDADRPLDIKTNISKNGWDWYGHVLFLAVKFLVAGQDTNNVYRNGYQVGIVELDLEAPQFITREKSYTRPAVTYAPVLVAESVLQSTGEFRGHTLWDIGSRIIAQAVALGEQEPS
jgi:hypothetical protein